MHKFAKVNAIWIAALCVATALPSYAETHTLQPYAYVESYGHNAVDTGYYAKKDTKFVADFAFVSTASLTMANVSVAEGQTLTIDCADGIRAKAVKVNTILAADIRRRIRLNGLRPRQTSDGYLCYGGLSVTVR